METLLLILIVICIILTVIVLVLFLRMRSKKTGSLDNPDGPSQVTDSALTVHVVPHPFKFASDPGNALNGPIVEAINRMGGTGTDAEEKFQNSINRLRPSAEKVIEILVKEYNDLPEQSYLDRWSVVQLLSELKHPAALPFFDKLLQTKIPPERYKDTSFDSSVGEEVIIRTTAVEGMVRLGKAGNEAAMQLVLKHARHENFSVKRACIQGYQEFGLNNAVGELSKLLDGRDKSILDIKRRDVKNIPQPKADKTQPAFKKNDKPGMPPPFSN